MKKLVLTILIILALWGTSEAATYYVDPDSNDNCDGLSQTVGVSGTCAWKTIAKVNASTFSAGDSILFKKGDVWRETLTVPSSGSSGSPITIGAYGTGANPIIYGSLAGDWTRESDNYWYTTGVTATPTIVWKDGARITKTTTKADINTDTGLTKWYFDDAQDRVYVYGAGATPPVGTIEIALRSYAINAVDKSYITVDGVSLKYVNLTALNASVSSATATNWTVKNCYIAGAWKRGISIEGDATHSANYVNINTNTILGIGGASGGQADGSSIRVTYADHVSIYSNTVTMSGYTGMNNYAAGIEYVHAYSAANTNSSVYSNTINGTNSVSTMGAGLVFGDIYYTKVYSNDISGAYKFGIWTDETSGGGDNGSFNCEYYKNKIVLTGTAGYGFNLEVSKNDLVHHNIIDVKGGTDAWAFWMGVGRVADSYLTNTQIYHNAFLTGGGGITIQLGSTVYGTRKLGNVTLKNNIIYGNTASGALLKVNNNISGDNGHVFNNNLYYDAGTPAYLIQWFGSNYSSLANFKTAHATQEVSGVAGDPLFVSSTNYSIQTTSPAKNAGVNLCTGTNVPFTGCTGSGTGIYTDYAGASVMSAPDIGAYEYQEGAAPIIYSNNFDYFTSDTVNYSSSIPILDSTGSNFASIWLNPNQNYCYSACHNHMWPITITTAASRIQGPNKRGFRRLWGWNQYYDSGCADCNGGGPEAALFHSLGANYKKLYIRWYERPSWNSITSLYIKLFRIHSPTRQGWVPEWRTDITGSVGKARMIVGMDPFDWSKDIWWTGFDYKTYAAAHPYEWTCFELMIDITNNDMDFWVNGELITGKQRNGTTMCSHCSSINYMSIGGNTTAVSVDDNQYADYDDIKLSTGYIGPEPSTSQFTVGGTVSGMSGGTLMLRDAFQDIAQEVVANGTYSITGRNYIASDQYAIEVLYNPGGYKCTVSNGSGTVSSANVSNVNVSCVTSKTSRSGGRVSGGRSR